MPLFFWEPQFPPPQHSGSHPLPLAAPSAVHLIFGGEGWDRASKAGRGGEGAILPPGKGLFSSTPCVAGAPPARAHTCWVGATGAHWGGGGGGAAVLGTGASPTSPPPPIKAGSDLYPLRPFPPRPVGPPAPPPETPLRGRCPFKRRGQAVATETAEALLGGPARAGLEAGRGGGDQGLGGCGGRGGCPVRGAVGVTGVGTGGVGGFGGRPLPPHLGARQQDPPGEAWSPPPSASRRPQPSRRPPPSS